MGSAAQNPPHDLPAPGLARRPVLGGVVAAVSALLAGCGADSSPTPGAASSPGSSSLGTSTSSTSPQGSAASTAGDQPLAELADIPVGGAVSAQSPDAKPIIVAQPTKGQAVAFSAICTHMGCTVAPAGAKLNCPCHGSVFDALTGKVITGPAPAPLPTFAVRVSDGAVVAG